jgi:hypothetical protein
VKTLATLIDFLQIHLANPLNRKPTVSVTVGREADEMMQPQTDQWDTLGLSSPGFAPRVALDLPPNTMGKLTLISVLERVFSVLQGEELLMKKLLLAFLTVAVLTATVPSMVAQDNIVLYTSFANSLKFTGTGSGGFSMSFNNKGGTVGQARGFGPNIGGPTSCGGSPCFGTYKFIQKNGAGGSITSTLITPGCNAVCNWSIAMAKDALLFDFGPGGGHNHGQWLQGNVVFESFTQTASGGLFHDTMVADLHNLTGLLAAYFPNGALLDLTLKFTTGQDLSQLALGKSVSDGIGGGDVTQTPEPGTMALIGSGILLLGGYLRKRARV